MVITALKNRIGFITLNRPEKRNAFSPDLVKSIKEAFQFFSDEPSCKVIILKANGPTFSAGADLAYLKELQNNTYNENLADSNNLKELFEKIYSLNKVVIAQVEGSAIAGGCGLATVCDFVYAVPDAKFGYTEVKIGFIPAIVSVFLLKKIGDSKTRELLFTGNLYSALEFEKLGLVKKVVAVENIENEVLSLANHLIENCSSESLALTKSLLNEVAHLPVNTALNIAAESNAKARATSDCKKGISAFLNKKKITW